MSNEDYRAIADALAADIASGRLRPGERLPPQRVFAYERGVAASTASRVYGELRRRGLVTGEVGRGTYVRAGPEPFSPVLTEPTLASVDLELNVPILPGQGAALSSALAALLRPDVFTQALRSIGAGGTVQAREIAARFLSRRGWTPVSANVLFTGNGRQAIAAAMAALAPPGARIGVEAMTFPVVKGLAARLGVTLVPIGLDEEGLRPDAVADAHRATPLHGVYLQPTLHNPLGATMSRRRREELAAVLEATGLVAIEDAIYSFLADEEPLAAFAPERTIIVESLSKRIAPGLTLGLIAAPADLTDKIASAIRSGGWSAAGVPLVAGTSWMADGTIAQIEAAKRKDAVERQVLARDILSGLATKGDPRAYHLWLELPACWRAEAFGVAAARRGIAITPAAAFTINSGYAPNAVRLALAQPTLETLAAALRILHRLALSDPSDSGVE